PRHDERRYDRRRRSVPWAGLIARPAARTRCGELDATSTAARAVRAPARSGTSGPRSPGPAGYSSALRGCRTQPNAWRATARVGSRGEHNLMLSDAEADERVSCRASRRAFALRAWSSRFVPKRVRFGGSEVVPVPRASRLPNARISWYEAAGPPRRRGGKVRPTHYERAHRRQDEAHTGRPAAMD